MTLEIEKIYNDSEELKNIFNYLDSLEIEYRKQYKGMYGRTMSVPRGQASFTLTPDIHYDYKVSGGSPPNKVMCNKLKEITEKVNKTFNTNYNTILMNVYKDGEDCIGFHRDKTNGWAENSGFCTLSFGAERDFIIRKIDNINDKQSIIHENGMAINMPYPMNDIYHHSVPKRKKIKDTRISLTFREIIDKIKNT
tara:strand:- start:44 stop:628 length:585 start_codon:yes stop_codon:yes gene_type:complete